MSDRPLSGRRVVVTRATHQAGRLADAFAAAGALVVRLPLIEVVPPEGRALERAARRAAGFDWLVFTSANAVRAFLALVTAPLPVRLRAAAVGQATAQALRRRGIEPALTAREPRAEGLFEVLSPRLTPGTRLLIPQAADARGDLARGLRAAGAEVTAVVAYRKRLPSRTVATARELFSASPLGWVTCTSPRIVRHFAELFASDWERRRGEMKAVSIGPVTSAELRRLGVEPAAEARRPSDEGLVGAMVKSVSA